MVQEILILALVLFLMFPTASKLESSNHRRQNVLLTTLVALGLGIGILTLIMMWEGILRIPLSTTGILLPYMIITLPSFRRILQHGQQYRLIVNCLQNPWKTWRPRLWWILILIITVAVIFNAIYWPFHKPDALGIYADQAHYIFVTRALIPLSLDNYGYYQAYPMLVQLLYVFSYLISGWENPYAAKLFSTLLSLGSLGVVYVLGSFCGKPVARLSSLLLSLTPGFAYWASSGYADLPMTFYYSLTIVFALRFWLYSRFNDAVLVGLMLGFALWTKNAALPGILIVAIFFSYGLLKRKMKLSHVATSLILCGLVAGPWYLRNLLDAGLLIPATAWVDRAAPTINNLLVFATLPKNFGITGWLILTSVIGGQFIKQSTKKRSQVRPIILLFTAPFWMLWFFFVSYDPRLILPIVPALSVIGAMWGWFLWNNLFARYQKFLRLPVLMGILMMTVYVAWTSIEYKVEILRHPLMDDSAKQVIVQGE